MIELWDEPMKAAGYNLPDDVSASDPGAPWNKTQDEELDEDDLEVEGICERCGEKATTAQIPFLGFSLWLCAGCAAAAYYIGEAV